MENNDESGALKLPQLKAQLRGNFAARFAVTDLPSRACGDATRQWFLTEGTRANVLRALLRENGVTDLSMEARCRNSPKAIWQWQPITQFSRGDSKFQYA